jgi:hypothetical protein
MPNASTESLALAVQPSRDKFTLPVGDGVSNQQ